MLIFLLSSLKLMFLRLIACLLYLSVALVRIPNAQLVVGDTFAVVDAFVVWFPADVIAWLRMSLLGYVL